MNASQRLAPLLAVGGLSVEIATRRGSVAATTDVSFEIAEGEIVGIVGESGSGKSVTSLAVMGILPQAARVVGGAIRFAGRELDRDGRRKGDRDGLAIIFQNPRGALNPIRQVGHQIADAVRAHSDLSAKAGLARAIELLDQVRIREPAQRFRAYPFELSGGMCQRVMIAIALACEPRLLIADEPTTGLDVTTQKAIADLIVDLSHSRGMATVLITHDLALAGERCARLIVMQGGRVVEAGTSEAILCHPNESYTRSLVAATPLNDSHKARRSDRASDDPLIEVEGLTRLYRLRGTGNPLTRLTPWLAGRSSDPSTSVLKAVNEVSFTLRAGESVALVGESGSGKSTLASILVRLIDATSGNIRFRGREIGNVPARKFARESDRRNIQMVFQDPTASLNPRQTVFDGIAEPIRRLGDIKRKPDLSTVVSALAERVGLSPSLLRRLPHQLSGGEKARVGIARAIALNPSLLVLDEPTAALDVRVQAVVLQLLMELRQQFGMTYLFVTHDLAVVRQICDRVLVMRGGQIVDSGSTEELLNNPTHPYTRSLVAAIPRRLAAATLN